MMKKGNKLTILLGIAAYEGYRFYKGKGIFNKMRFTVPHKAAADYVASHYPNGFYSEIVPTDEGWSCVITHSGGKTALYMTQSSDGRFIFWEKDI